MWLSRKGAAKKTDPDFVEGVKVGGPQFRLPPAVESLAAQLWGATRTTLFDVEDDGRKPIKRRVISPNNNRCGGTIGFFTTGSANQYFDKLRQVAVRALNSLPTDFQTRINHYLTEICKSNFLLISDPKGNSQSSYIFDILLYESMVMRNSGFTNDQIKAELYHILSNGSEQQPIAVIVNCLIEALEQRYVLLSLDTERREDMKYALRSVDPRIFFKLNQLVREALHTDKKGVIEIRLFEDGKWQVADAKTLQGPEITSARQVCSIICYSAEGDKIRDAATGRETTDYWMDVGIVRAGVETPIRAKMKIMINEADIELSGLFYPFRIVEELERMDDVIRRQQAAIDPRGLESKDQPGFKKRGYFSPGPDGKNRVFCIYPAWMARGKWPELQFLIDPELKRGKPRSESAYIISIGTPAVGKDGSLEATVSLLKKGRFGKYKSVAAEKISFPTNEGIWFIGNSSPNLPAGISVNFVNVFDGIKEDGIRNAISEVHLAVCLVNGHYFVVDCGKNNLMPVKGRTAIYAGEYIPPSVD